MKKVHIALESRYEFHREDRVGRPTISVVGYIGATGEYKFDMTHGDGYPLSSTGNRQTVHATGHNPRELIRALQFAAGSLEEALTRLEDAADAVEASAAIEETDTDGE